MGISLISRIYVIRKYLFIIIIIHMLTPEIYQMRNFFENKNMEISLSKSREENKKKKKENQ